MPLSNPDWTALHSDHTPLVRIPPVTSHRGSSVDPIDTQSRQQKLVGRAKLYGVSERERGREGRGGGNDLLCRSCGPPELTPLQSPIRFVYYILDLIRSSIPI